MVHSCANDDDYNGFDIDCDGGDGGDGWDENFDDQNNFADWDCTTMMMRRMPI